MTDNVEDAAGANHSAPYRLIVAGFIVSAVVTSFVAKALGASHIMGLVPLGGLVGAALAEWLWRARRKA